MNGFFDKLQRFMMGRNGFDKLCRFLFILYALLVVTSFFLIRFSLAHLIIYILELMVAGYIVFRVLSKNLYKRSRENMAYMKIETAVINFFLRQKNRFRDIKTHRYVKCKTCKAQLRVRRVKGKHTVRCPKCGNTFGVNIH